jgi:hypothetical protein
MAAFPANGGAPCSNLIWVWLLWNNGPHAGVKAALVLIDVELPLAIKIC